MRFYTVFSPEGEAPAKVSHATHKEAFAIAHSMARAYPGQTFFVMKSASNPISLPRVHDTVADSDGDDAA